MIAPSLFVWDDAIATTDVVLRCRSQVRRQALRNPAASPSDGQQLDLHGQLEHHNNTRRTSPWFLCTASLRLALAGSLRCQQQEAGSLDRHRDAEVRGLYDAHPRSNQRHLHCGFIPDHGGSNHGSQRDPCAYGSSSAQAKRAVETLQLGAVRALRRKSGTNGKHSAPSYAMSALKGCSSILSEPPKPRFTATHSKCLDDKVSVRVSTSAGHAGGSCAASHRH